MFFVLFYFVSIYLFAFESTHNAVAGIAIAVRIHCLAHTLVGGGVVEEDADFADDEVVVGPHEMDGAALKGFGTLGGVAHHEDGLAQTGGLFLDAPAVGEDYGGLLHQINKLQVLEGFDEEEIAILGEVIAKHLVNRLPHIGVKVHGIDKVHVEIFLTEIFHGCNHADETFAKVFPTVAGDENKFLSVAQSCDIVAGCLQDIDLLTGKGFIALKFIDHHM